MRDVLTQELRDFLDGAIGVDGALVATTDGLLLAGVVSREQEEVLAAMCSAASGLGSQFAAILGFGPATTTVVQAAGGCIAVHPMLGTAILLVYSRDPANVALLHLAVRQGSQRLTRLLGAQSPGATGDLEEHHSA